MQRRHNYSTLEHLHSFVIQLNKISQCTVYLLSQSGSISPKLKSFGIPSSAFQEAPIDSNNPNIKPPPSTLVYKDKKHQYDANNKKNK